MLASAGNVVSLQNLAAERRSDVPVRTTQSTEIAICQGQPEKKWRLPWQQCRLPHASRKINTRSWLQAVSCRPQQLGLTAQQHTPATTIHVTEIDAAQTAAACKRPWLSNTEQPRSRAGACKNSASFPLAAKLLH